MSREGKVWLVLAAFEAVYTQAHFVCNKGRSKATVQRAGSDH